MRITKLCLLLRITFLEIRNGWKWVLSLSITLRHGIVITLLSHASKGKGGSEEQMLKMKESNAKNLDHIDEGEGKNGEVELHCN